LDRGDRCYFILDLAAIKKKRKTDFRSPLTPAKLLGGDQKISNGAANTSFLLLTLQYIGATNQIAPMYWCC
jgi:hypothetical protein